MSVDDFSSWPFAAATWVHTGGITPALSTSCDELVERIIGMASAHDYRVSFDVNYRSALWVADEAAARCSFLGNQCHLVLVGLDEAATLWGVEAAEDVASIFPLAPLIVVKDGGVEAVELALQADGTRRVTRVPALSVAVVEAIGAGDAFAAGYIGGLLRGVHSLERLAAGHELAAWTLGSLADFRPRDNQPETRS
jgi:2-dehydro-3-deoxygluconokinase